MPFALSARDRVERLVERFAGDEPLGEFLREAVVPDEAEDLRLDRQIEEGLSEHGRGDGDDYGESG